MAVYTKIINKDIRLINSKFNIDEIEIIKENVVFKVPNKLN